MLGATFGSQRLWMVRIRMEHWFLFRPITSLSVNQLLNPKTKNQLPNGQLLLFGQSMRLRIGFGLKRFHCLRFLLKGGSVELPPKVLPNQQNPASPIQEPNGLDGQDELQEDLPSPVDVRIQQDQEQADGKGDQERLKRKKSKRRGFSAKKKAQKTRASTAASARPPNASAAEDSEVVLGSFDECYRATIKALPVCLWPKSTKHGQYSYTVYLGH